jgi:hypothetical protein
VRQILTLFDKTKNLPKPLLSLVIDEEISFHEFYFPGTGQSLKQIREHISSFSKLYLHGEVALNDYKSHFRVFNIDREIKAFDLCIWLSLHGELSKIKKMLCEHAKNIIGKQALEWQHLLAMASQVYALFESRPIRVGYKDILLKYELDTLTGRARTPGFNIQGTNSEYDIKPEFDKFVFIVFDWLAADLRMAAHMSGDQIMIDSFKDSDPYTMLTEFLHDPDFDRDAIKVRLIKALYSLSVDDPIFNLFPDFKCWMADRIVSMRENGCLSSILGRKFHVSDENELGVFNAQFQGSVAHAMQAVLVRVNEVYPDYLFTELHDSLILACPEGVINEVINTVTKLMLEPFQGWMIEGPRMPVRVSIGLRWKDWTKLRIYR